MGGSGEHFSLTNLRDSTDTLPHPHPSHTRAHVHLHPHKLSLAQARRIHFAYSSSVFVHPPPFNLGMGGSGGTSMPVRYSLSESSWERLGQPAASHLMYAQIPHSSSGSTGSSESGISGTSSMLPATLTCDSLASGMWKLDEYKSYLPHHPT